MNIIEQYGFHPTQPIPYTTQETTKETLLPARVTAVHRGRYDIVCNAGTGPARLKSGAYYADDALYPTTGDFVLLDWQDQGESRIYKTLPRKSFFSRLDPSSAGRREQAVAANFDTVFLLQSLNTAFRPRGLERYLTLAWQSGAVPVVVLTKADAAADLDTWLCAASSVAPGVDVFAVSAKTGLGLDRLEPYLKPGKTVVLLGPSGVGKSSLINALAGEDRMPVGGIREKDGRGRHTTTRRQLMRLNSGVLVIDTPGMRELGMWDSAEGLEQSFADVEQYFGGCKFNDCRHQGEPGCAVAAAIRRGDLSQDRWESYQKLHAETRFQSDKAGYLREKKDRFKRIAVYQKQLQKTDYRHTPCSESFTCKVCGALVLPEGAGSQHRNHCPNCLSSIHLDHRPGDRSSLCRGVMDPIGVWVRKNGEWAVIHRCRDCGAFSANRIAADDNRTLLLSIAMKPLAAPPFPLWQPDPDPAENTREHQA